MNHPMDHIVVSLLADSLHFPTTVLQSHRPPHLQEDVIVVLLWEVVKGEWGDLADPLEGLIFHIDFMVDSFHIRNHGESCCTPPNNPNCQYHPTLPKISEIHSVNTKCAEQSFRWLNRFKYSMRNMHQYF